MTKVLERMIAVDVIVMATPVYFCTMDAQMKTLIDWTCPRYTRISDKEIYFIMTAADSAKQAIEKAMQGSSGFTSCLTGEEEKGVIYRAGVWNVGEIIGSIAMDQAYEREKTYDFVARTPSERRMSICHSL
jgi:multimeric flavodoxin WrbA